MQKTEAKPDLEIYNILYIASFLFDIHFYTWQVYISFCDGNFKHILYYVLSIIFNSNVKEIKP